MGPSHSHLEPVPSLLLISPFPPWFSYLLLQPGKKMPLQPASPSEPPPQRRLRGAKTGVEEWDEGGWGREGDQGGKGMVGACQETCGLSLSPYAALRSSIKGSLVPFPGQKLSPGGCRLSSSLIPSSLLSSCFPFFFLSAASSPAPVGGSHSPEDHCSEELSGGCACL